MLLRLLCFLGALATCQCCESWEQLRVLGCVGGLGDWALSSLHPSLVEQRQGCRRFADFEACASVVPAECRRTVAGALEDVYGVMCNETMINRLDEQSDCWNQMSHNTLFRNCQIESVVNGTVERCESLQSYLDCAQEHFWDSCPEAVRILHELFTTSQTTCANISFVPPTTSTTSTTTTLPPDPLIPKCSGGACVCIDGYAYDAALDSCLDVDECAQLGVCSQRCENGPGSFACTCNDEYYHLDEDNSTCIRNDNSSIWIFFAHGQSIWNISSDGKDFQLQRAALQKTAMIDIDVQSRRLYYADIGANKVERMLLEGAFPNTLQSFDVEGTEGIAVDWVGRNLYSLRQRGLVVQALDGRFRRVLYAELTTLPRALALHPLIGYAYVTDWSGEAFVGRAAMDGSRAERLITDGVVWPNGLAVDFFADRIYWADAFLDTIESADLNGLNRRTVIAKSGSVPHVFGLSVVDDYMYWTDWTYRGILRADKHTGENVTVLAQTALLPYGIKIFHSVMQPIGENPCESMNCSQLCLVGPGNGTATQGSCSCAQGWELDPKDGVSCLANCGASQLLCGGSDPKCISKLHWCDGSVQCRDGADEANCPDRRCLPGQFQCHDSTKCLHTSSMCDGNPQCDDESDERYCEQ